MRTLQVVNSRGITVNTRRNLVEVRSESREAVFQDLDNPDNLETVKVRSSTSINDNLHFFSRYSKRSNQILIMNINLLGWNKFMEELKDPELYLILAFPGSGIKN